MSTDVTTPADFDFTGRYYPQILESLIKWLRGNVPEVSTENPVDPAIQLLRAFALTGHLNNVLLDLQAQESIMATARLRDTVVLHLALIDFQVPGDIPAKSSVVAQLSRTFTDTQDIIQSGAQFSTKRVSDAEPVYFEADQAVSITRTDRPTAVYVYDASGDAFTDVTTSANTDSSTFTALPATPAAGDCLYIIHSTVMSDKLTFGGVSTPGAGYVAVWEVHKDSTDDASPDTVSVAGTQLKVIIDGMFGTTSSRAGLGVVVRLNSSGATASCTSLHDGTHNYVMVDGFLGQTSPSTSSSDYTVGSNWYQIPGLNDDTAGACPLALSGGIDYPLPKTATYDWNKATVNGTSGYAVRLRVISVTTPTAPVLDRIKWDGHYLFVETTVTQGRSQVESSIGTSDGSADQTYQLGADPVIPGTVAVMVDGVFWTSVDDFLVSTGSDNHVVVSIDSDGVGTIAFGDGINGKIPPATAIIGATYRTDADQDGNVGSETIVRANSGVLYVRNIYNPRAATGWSARRGATDSDLARVKLEGVASLRDLGRVVSGDDAANIAVRWTSSDGSKPVKRAFAIEGGSGYKTVTLYVVAPDGGQVSVDHRLELETLFNGDATLGTPGITVANQRVFVREYTPVPIDVTATVVGGNEESVKTALTSLLNPLAVEDDGVTYTWQPGQAVPDGRVESAIWRSAGRITTVSMSSPSGPTTVGVSGFPVVGTLNITAA